MKPQWLTAEEALKRLGTKPQTLYANVSRGRIRAKPDPADSRRSLYQAEDVARLSERHSGPRGSAAVASETIRWGQPLLPTTISAIDDGRLYYRGRDAVELSQELTLEEIAGLLWQTTPIVLPEISPEKGGVPPVAKALSALAGRVASDLPALGRRPAVLRSEAGAIMATVAAALAPGAQALQPLHERLAHGWKRPDASEPIRKALVLTAEHELNVSAFAARVTASSGAALSAAVLSGLATLTGPRHGGAWRDVTMLAAQARMHGVREAINAGLSSEGLLRAFGHRLYPHGDPRAKALMASFEAPSLYRDLAEAGEELLGEPVNIDFALAGLAVAFDLPSDAPLVMFALARTAGWLAHAMEQVESGELIRPRARYTEAEQQVS